MTPTTVVALVMLIVAALVGIVCVAIRDLRRRDDQKIDDLIQTNAYRYRAGMESMDWQASERAAAARRRAARRTHARTRRAPAEAPRLLRMTDGRRR